MLYLSQLFMNKVIKIPGNTSGSTLGHKEYFISPLQGETELWVENPKLNPSAPTYWPSDLTQVTLGLGHHT